MLIEIPYSYATEDTKKELFIEYCGSCKGIWLDNKELTSVLIILKKFRIQARLDRLKSLIGKLRWEQKAFISLLEI